MEMSLSEFYALLEEDNCKYEAWRKRKPCCANCKHYYEEYGTELCKEHGCPPEEITDVYCGKCGCWK